MQIQSLDWEDPLEKRMATHWIILAWRIPWTEEPERLQSMASQRVGLSTHSRMPIGEGDQRFGNNMQHVVDFIEKTGSLLFVSWRLGESPFQKCTAMGRREDT